MKNHRNIFSPHDILEPLPGNQEEPKRKALERRNALAPDDDPNPNKKLSRKCFEEVNKIIPPDTLWMPN